MAAEDNSEKASVRRGQFLIYGLSALVIVSMVLTGVLLLGIAKTQDKAAAARALALARTAIDKENEALARVSHDYTFWGDAYRHLHLEVDKDWAFNKENFGPSLRDDFKIDYVFVIGPDGRTVYGVVDGELSDAPAETVLSGGLPALLAQAQEEEAGEEPRARLGLLRTVDGRPLLASAEPLGTGNDPTVEVREGPASIAVFGSLLNDERLAALGEPFFLNRLRLARDAEDAAAGPSVALTPVDGQAPVLLRWNQERPGQAMLAATAPWLGLGMALLGLLTWRVVRHAVRSAALVNAGTVRLASALNEARHIASHDLLTGLPNRRGLMQSIEEMMAARAGRPMTVAYIDVDRFKTVNDSLGHPVGDQVLASLANRLLDSLPPADLVARVGSDEFAVVSLACRDEAAAAALCRQIEETTAQPFPVGAATIHVTLSIGMAHDASGAIPADEMLRRADIALYHAKAERRGSYRAFDGAMDEAIVSRRALENDLRAALARGEFLLHFQPRFDVATLKLVRVEALLRWQHPQRGLVGPESFIQAAEETGLIAELGAWVLERACEAASRWPAVGISVNVSTVQLLRGDLPQLVAAALAATRIEPSRLELELTESVLFADKERAQAILGRFKSMGVRLALDDFGTGFSSLGYLMHYPFDCLKVDRSFLGDLAREGSARAILQAMISLGRALNMTVTAEGVETEEQLALLRADRCDEVQGYYLSHPLPEAALMEFMASHAGRLRNAAAGHVDA